MVVPDANMLVYAYDSTSPEHARARAWWESVLSGREMVGIPWIVALAFVRLMTHPVICTEPLDTWQVRQRVESWFELRHVRMLVPSGETFRAFFDLLEAAGMGGNLSTDALVAAHAIEHSAVVCSNNRDFERFPGLRLRNPLRA